MKTYLQYTWSLRGNLQVEFDHYIKDGGSYILKLNRFFKRSNLVENRTKNNAIGSKRNRGL